MLWPKCGDVNVTVNVHCDHGQPPAKPVGSLGMRIGPVSEKRTAQQGVPKMDLVLNNEQKCLLTINPLTAGGNPAPVDGAPQWATADATIATVEPAADGLTCTVRSGDVAGTTTVTVTADADLGDGTQTLSEVVNVIVVQAQASTLGVTAGTPEQE